MVMKKKKSLPVNNVSLIKRFFAYLLDYYFGLLLCSLPIVLANGIVNQSDVMQTNLYLFADQPKVLYLVAIFSLILGYFYYVHIPLHVWRGQTVAKRMLHFKIVKDNGDPVDFKALFLRYILGMMLIEGSLICCTSIFTQLLSYSFSIDFMKPWNTVGMIITILSIVWMLFNPQHKMFHDYIAKTIVTNTEDKN